MLSRTYAVSLVGLATLLPTASSGAVVGFVGTIANTCVLTVTTPGILATSAAGTTLSSEESGGVEALMTVISTGSTPTISFAVPTLTGPAASTAGATKEIAFTSTGGANQGFVPTAVSYVMNRLNDTMSVKGRVTNSSGFVSGAYTLSTVVTCQQ